MLGGQQDGKEGVQVDMEVLERDRERKRMVCGMDNWTARRMCN